MEWLGLAMAIAALVYAVWSHRRAARAIREARQCHDRITKIRLELLRELDAAKSSIAKTVRLEIMKARGELHFTRQTTIAEAIGIDSRVKDVMAQFHIGGCSSCSVSYDETLEQGARSHGVDPDELLEALNALLEGRPIHVPHHDEIHTPQPITIGGITPTPREPEHVEAGR